MIITILMSLISIVCGFVLIFNPMESVNTLIVSLGVIIIAQSCSNIVDLVILKKYMNKIVKRFKSYF